MRHGPTHLMRQLNDELWRLGGHAFDKGRAAGRAVWQGHQAPSFAGSDRCVQGRVHLYVTGAIALDEDATVNWGDATNPRTHSPVAFALASRYAKDVKTNFQ